MEQEIQETIGRELALNVTEQFGMAQAMSFPQNNWNFFDEFTVEVRSTW